MDASHIESRARHARVHREDAAGTGAVAGPAVAVTDGHDITCHVRSRGRVDEYAARCRCGHAVAWTRDRSAAVMEAARHLAAHLNERIGL